MNSSSLIGVIGVALVGWLGYNNLYVPQERQAQQILAQIAKEQANQHTQAEVAALLQRIERYRARLAQDPDPSALVRDVVTLAQTAGLSVTGLTQEAPQQRDSATRLGVTLQLTGSYHQLGTFVAALERSPRFVRVERVRIARPEQGEEPAAVQMVLSTLYLPPLLATPKAQDATPPSR